MNFCLCNAEVMEVRIAVQPQLGANYLTLLTVAQACERFGFPGFFMADHLMSMRDPLDALPGPTDVWTSLAAMARETSRIRLGTLMTSANFRLPGMLAVQVAQVDEMSGGRVELGIGAGWSEAEHRAYGIPFPARRFSVLEEQLSIITGLWATPVGERYSYSGQHYEVENSPALPKPVQSPLPILIGGKGSRRTPELAARFAAEYNGSYASDQELPTMLERRAEACDAIGRDPNTLTFSIMSSMGIGANDSEIQERARASGKTAGELRASGVGGTPTQAVERLNQLESAGVQRIYLQLADFADLDHLELVAKEVLPHV